MLFQDVAAVSRHEFLTAAFPEIIGRSPQMMQVLDLVAKVARSDSAVLIRGESGTGKELIARAIHRLSMRAEKPFLALNCSAIPENLLESELFGHEKGAFTGADRRHAGLFERAHGGTLFLDEIGDMAIGLQSKLLRVLQEKRFTPVGGTEVKKAEVRIITATNVNLVDAMEKGLFRSDLYYRINVLPVDLPALRSRADDVLDLLSYFLSAANRIHTNQPECFFNQEVTETLLKHAWPGNVRQLQNLVERLVVISGGGEIRIEHLPPEILNQNSRVSTNALVLANETFQRSHSPAAPIPPQKAQVRYPDSFGVLPDDGVDLATYIESLENNLIMQALERTGNNRNQAAKLLGMNRTTLVERLKKRRIDVPNAS